jgi:hypothetical protein
MTIWKVRQRKRNRAKGSILIEGLLVLSFLMIPVVGLNLELIRAGQKQVELHDFCFSYTRCRALGGKDTQCRNFGGPIPHQRSTAFIDSKGIEGKAVIRYYGFFRFLHDRFQMTKRCHFSS